MGERCGQERKRMWMGKEWARYEREEGAALGKQSGGAVP